MLYRSHRNEKADTLLASALAVAEAQVVTPPPPAPGSPPPVQPPGTFRTDRERLEAAVPRLQQAADAFPNTEAGITARFRLAAAMAELGRFAEAEQRFTEVVQKTSQKDIYHDTARLGLGEAQLAGGKEATLRSPRSATCPDAIQAPGRRRADAAWRAASRRARKMTRRALHARVDEVPQSLYVSDAEGTVDANQEGVAGTANVSRVNCYTPRRCSGRCARRHFHAEWIARDIPMSPAVGMADSPSA